MKQLTMLLLALAFLAACTPKATPRGYDRTGLVVCAEHDDETLTVVSSAAGGNRDEAIYNAERQAFENILFKGVPKCNQKRPLVEDESAARRTHGQYFAELLDGNGLRRFVSRSFVSESVALGQGVGIDQTVQIDLNGLRRDLERAGVIRSFGL